MADAEIKHDGFARVALMRRALSPSILTCAWCGGRRKGGGLFLYGTHCDGLSPRIDWDRHKFCCIGCRRAYYNP